VSHDTVVESTATVVQVSLQGVAHFFESTRPHDAITAHKTITPIKILFILIDLVCYYYLILNRDKDKKIKHNMQYFILFLIFQSYH
jgi:hypothetical protein